MSVLRIDQSEHYLPPPLPPHFLSSSCAGGPGATGGRGSREDTLTDGSLPEVTCHDSYQGQEDHHHCPDCSGGNHVSVCPSPVCHSGAELTQYFLHEVLKFNKLVLSSSMLSFSLLFLTFPPFSSSSYPSPPLPFPPFLSPHFSSSLLPSPRQVPTFLVVKSLVGQGPRLASAQKAGKKRTRNRP